MVEEPGEYATRSMLCKKWGGLSGGARKGMVFNLYLPLVIQVLLIVRTE